MAVDRTDRGEDRTRRRPRSPAAEFGLGPVRLRIEPAFLLVAALLGVGVHGGAFRLLVWVLVALVSILLHELAHAVVVLAFGDRPRITLGATGGRTNGRDRDGDRSKDVAISLAGPLAQALLIGLPALLVVRSGAMTSPTAQVIVRDVALINLGWAAISLLPILPLDGGTITTIVIRRMRVSEPMRLARMISVGTAFGLSIWAWNSVGVVVALWAVFFAASNAAGLARRTANENWSRGRSLRASPLGAKQSKRAKPADDAAPNGRPQDLHID